MNEPQIMMFGWTVGQWSTVNGYCEHLLRTPSDYIKAKLVWNLKHPEAPTESEVDPVIEMHMMSSPHSGMSPIDSNTSALDAGHKKATTHPPRATCSHYGSSSDSSWITGLAIGIGLADC